ncbi:response regulator [Paenibacillus sp. 1011MAR3C5]|uniref:response regulator transcription factor n=1 Tax=Paenibacillus sp. 1011MAR3C5 TaxID=1675787 RepID=UPI00160361D4|nr:response regulator [Paenibacillus sp. 1011MAR3C5]
MYKLLIVDDEPMTREYMKAQVNSLHREWICAGEAGDGREALELLEQGEDYDLIVTDIKMPIMTGLELARELAGRGSRPRMVILSGYDEFALAKEAMQYGVHDYMLKPIVNEELVSVLDKMAKELAAERAEQAALQSLLVLSEQSRGQIARNFLHALISDNNMEIKLLYPLLHRLKISLIEAEGAIMLVDLDEGQLLERDISPTDLVLFRYIVHQTCAELAASDSPSIVLFSDNEQRTALLVPGEDAANVRQRCAAIFGKLSAAVQEMTGLQLWGSVGSSEMEVLQLGQSYRLAREALWRKLIAGEDALLATEDGAPDASDEQTGNQAEQTVAAVHRAMLEGRYAQLYASLLSLAEAAGTADRRSVLRTGACLLQVLAETMPKEKRQHQTAAALLLLRDTALTQELYRPEEAAKLYERMIESLYNTPQKESAVQETDGSEHEIVKRAKEYILAHYAEPLSLALIAEKLGVSPGYLSSLFHQNTLEPYIKFLTRIRMERAAQLLQMRPAEKVYDVAEKVGYLSVKHFSYVFKQHFGIPPGEYQERAVR